MPGLAIYLFLSCALLGDLVGVWEHLSVSFAHIPVCFVCSNLLPYLALRLTVGFINLNSDYAQDLCLCL
jgi:hemolysin-activating ACP:hemolysin acyltransferase